VITDTTAALAFPPVRVLYAPAAASQQKGDALFNALLASQPREIWLGLAIGTVIAWSTAATFLFTRF